jgi:gas vesicle protein
MAKVGNFLLGAVLGFLVAGLVTILLAPSSGADLQEKIKGTVVNIQNEVNKAREGKRLELEHQLEKLRRPS